MKRTHAVLCRLLPKAQRDRMNRFHSDESGSMVVFTLFIIVLMLVIGGMAVDFMRFESRRAMMQGAVDSAVLAAADLDQNRLDQFGNVDTAGVVKDYLTKSQAGNCLNGTVQVDNSSPNYRSVSAQCELTMNTFFLKLIGMNQLTAAAQSTAVEGVGDIEVSMVLDISGSMGSGAAGGGTKIQALREAATAFVDTLLVPEFEDRISLSLVPYSAHVNVGEDIFGTLNVPPRHGWSHCVDIPDEAFETTTWDNAQPLVHTQHVSINWSMDDTICPRFEYEAILPLSQDATALNTRINQLQPRATTSIFQGVKWGATLLDPSFNTNVQQMAGVIDPEFLDRPAPFPDPANPTAGDVRKYMVVMTDGVNVGTQRLTPEAYDTPSEIAHWNTISYYNFWQQTLAWGDDSAYRETYHTTPDGINFMANACNAAKDSGIVIFGVGLYENSVHPSGPAAMRDCVTSPAYYFETSGAELTQIFEAIAAQITDLRLTL